MKKLLAALKPATGILLFALLYGVTLPFRPLFAPGEYDFAVFMLKIFPGMTGSILPKFPALAATMLTAVLVLALALCVPATPRRGFGLRAGARARGSGLYARLPSGCSRRPPSPC